MSSDIAIRVENLCKFYPIYDKPRHRLWQMLLRGKRKYYHEYWALNDVSFEIERGHSVGIIGRNGSGKSTLLQLICGTLNPTSGKVETRGRVAALLELGSGFNPDFTGRENVYLYAAMFGITDREIKARFEDICKFADIGEFIEQPIKTYSSGMFVRLAFSVVAHVDADILIIDEALAVGDVFFQQKCMRFLREFKSKGGTTLFVSHDTSSVVSLCDTAVLLFSAGKRQSIIGNPEEICKLYLEDLYAAPEREAIAKLGASHAQEINATTQDQKLFIGSDVTTSVYMAGDFRVNNTESFGVGGAEIVDAGFLNTNSEPTKFFCGDDLLTFYIKVKIDRQVNFPAFGLIIKNIRGEFLFTEGTDKHFRNQQLYFRPNDEAIVKFSFNMPNLIHGKYFINVAFADGIGDDHTQLHWIHDAIILECISSRLAHGYCGMTDVNISIEVNCSQSDNEK